MASSTIRILRPSEQVYAFYAGRDDYRPGPGQPTWVDEGLRLGTASYAVVDGEEALVVDTQTSLELAGIVRHTLEAAGVRHFTVLLTHHHLDHVAGTEVFADAEILSGQLTDDLLAHHQREIEDGTCAGPPAITPLIRANRILTGPTTITIANVTVELFGADIHSQDSYLAWLPASRTLLAADAVEDPITYLGEPDRIDIHLSELDRLAGLGAQRILPAHGDPEVIAAGGYGPQLIEATQTYLRTLTRSRTNPGLQQAPLSEWLAADLERGTLRLYPPYEDIHRQIVAQMLAESTEPGT